jgi:hypothetical protein
MLTRVFTRSCGQGLVARQSIQFVRTCDAAVVVMCTHCSIAMAGTSPVLMGHSGGVILCVGVCHSPAGCVLVFTLESWVVVPSGHAPCRHNGCTQHQCVTTSYY